MQASGIRAVRAGGWIVCVLESLLRAFPWAAGESLAAHADGSASMCMLADASASWLQRIVSGDLCSLMASLVDSASAFASARTQGASTSHPANWCTFYHTKDSTSRPAAFPS